MTKHCPLCEDELYSDDAGIRVGQSDICQSCFDEGVSFSMGEMSMWLNNVFDRTERQPVQATIAEMRAA